MQSKIVSDDGQFFVQFEDGARYPLAGVPMLEQPPKIALENGMIVDANLAVAVARVEVSYWKALAERRGQQLADLRASKA